MVQSKSVEGRRAPWNLFREDRGGRTRSSLLKLACTLPRGTAMERELVTGSCASAVPLGKGKTCVCVCVRVNRPCRGSERVNVFPQDKWDLDSDKEKSERERQTLWKATGTGNRAGTSVFKRPDKQRRKKKKTDKPSHQTHKTPNQTTKQKSEIH